MEEPAVIDQVCQHLVQNKARFWIDTHPTLGQLPYNKFRIVIGGHSPDIFGVDRFHRIFAVEAKGDTDIEKAIGQALSYKRGVMLSYIAADRASLEISRDIIESVGLGLFLVTPGTPSTLEVVEPRYSFFPQYLEDVRTQIDILLTEANPDVRLMTLGKTQLLNYVAPIFFFPQNKSTTALDTASLRTYITNEWGVNQERDSSLLAGCEYLDLIHRSGNKIALSPRGAEFRQLLERMGYNDKTLVDLKQQIGSKRKVAEQDPQLAYLIRTLYERKPEFRQLIKLLQSFEKDEVSFAEIIDEVVEEYPLLFINAFCKQNDDIINNVKAAYQRGDQNRIKTKRFLEECLAKNVYYSFKIQLLHLGVLLTRKFDDGRFSGGFDGKFDDYDLEKDIWVINPDLRA